MKKNVSFILGRFIFIKSTVLKYEGEQKIEAKDGVFTYEIIFVF